MRFDDFRQLVERLLREVPPAYLDGVVVVEVSPKAVPHPVRGDVYTLGECIPLEWSGNGANLQSRVVLYHGSFAALARVGGFDWREEAWETLSHELRHHLELRANSRALETYDWAAEQNFSRQEGQPFDPLFYRSGEKIADGVYKVEEDVFIRSEEHTSELQSLAYLVCRLLLEKKKKCLFDPQCINFQVKQHRTQFNCRRTICSTYVINISSRSSTRSPICDFIHTCVHRNDSLL